MIVISTDLSHYHDYKTSCELDLRTAVAIESLSPELLSTEDACGAYPLGVLCWLLRKALGRFTGWTSVTREIRPEIGRVVGYGAWMVIFPTAASQTQRKTYIPRLPGCS
ncbi:MAG: hypothetical protein Ct9H300mP28_05910 [Pseudomonadota bacterium]|nr:MAG: hypothetical protein Ct9H300mP28_05910 [Pseudomonadota bacterium]